MYLHVHTVLLRVHNYIYIYNLETPKPHVTVIVS